MSSNRRRLLMLANMGMLFMPIKIGILMRVIDMLKFQAGVVNVKARFQLSLDIRLDRLKLLPAGSVITTWQSRAAAVSCICQK